ncbi:TetR/AcrR family transcriptional regulator [Streptomyces rectiverticillatus]|uniref:TetR/AcrR family transcriptional regulator n=1 Tax=Streptomyces rectiverticillatus TaxID=173860 RepID=UPI0015C2C86A|nr:TetR/AcrR family transcriptional regulator [Streptomyces rectiverticillatus]QLE75376.1 TetR/AcrR family transcriptional regulator [Streptomyces rectiverticillatus]
MADDHTPDDRPLRSHDAAVEGLSLRERKKRQTRQRISDVATRLFAAKGFDKVTVAEVAEAAEVSTMTVFNHFARKEDLYLDRIPEALGLFTRAARERRPGESPAAPVHRLVLGLIDARHPLGGVSDTFPAFWRVVLDSPALRARVREAVEELENALAAAVAETSGTSPGEPLPRLAAALTVTTYRSVYATGLARLLAGERADDVAPAQRALADSAFAALEEALRTLGGPAGAPGKP